MSMDRQAVLTAQEAARRVALDGQLLHNALAAVPIENLGDPYTVHGGPLGDFCESLHDLVAHLLMWDEIDLAVLDRARAGRTHWSLDAYWETPAAGRALNRGGVAAGRELPADLLIDRFTNVRQAVVDELDAITDELWWSPPPLTHPAATSLAALAQHVMTVPGVAPYWHAAVHLGRLAEVSTDDQTRAS